MKTELSQAGKAGQEVCSATQGTLAANGPVVVYCLRRVGLPWQPDYVVDVVFADEHGYYGGAQAIRALMSPEECREADEQEAEMAAYDEWIGDNDEPPTAHFATIEEVVQWHFLIRGIAGIDFDITAFHAPSECGHSAHRLLGDALNELEKNAVWPLHSIPNEEADWCAELERGYQQDRM